jgi:hypothetical protein
MVVVVLCSFGLPALPDGRIELYLIDSLTLPLLDLYPYLTFARIPSLALFKQKKSLTRLLTL